MYAITVAAAALGLIAQAGGQQTARPQVYDESADAHTLVTHAIDQARADGKRILLVFGGNWCVDCIVLDKRFHELPARPIVDANFHVVHVDIGRGLMPRHMDLVKKYGIPLDKGVPAVAVLDSDGELLYSQKNGEFEPAARLDPNAIVEFLNRWKPARR